ncbi:MAG: hypothetical protein SX243_02115 [Acidobacteriota bacterium]|nr:hypothetical protein [Acidobacteriota bacterium]
MRCPRRSGEPGTGLAWDRLLEHRFDASLAPPACWPDVMEHLDHCPDCRHYAQDVDPTLMFRDLPEVTVTDADIAEMKLAVRTLRGSSAVQRTSGWPSRWQSLVKKARYGAEDLLAAPRRSPAAWRLAAAAVLALSLSASMVLPSGTDRHGEVGRQGEAVAQAGLMELAGSSPGMASAADGSVHTGSVRSLPVSWSRAGTAPAAHRGLETGRGVDTAWGSEPAGDSAWGSTSLGDSVVEDPVVEDVVSPGARVYSFQAPDEKMAVVMVIDPTLDV